MKLFYALIILTLLQNCSFDNKTGIWKNDNIITKDEKDSFEEFKTLSTEQEFFDKIISIKKNFNLEIPNQINAIEWKDIFYNRSNNFDNFKYNNSNQIILKSKKISNYKINESLLFIDNNLIVSDQKGNIIIYSISQKKILIKFNFYKKRFKKFQKKLNLIVKNNIIYVSDNLGYLYAYDYKNNKIIWAKNYKVPFRSNLKILKTNLLLQI
jgi:outer membrane protein assembly factor BamB